MHQGLPANLCPAGTSNHDRHGPTALAVFFAAHHQRPKLTPAFAKRSIAFGPAAQKAAAPQQLAGAAPAKAVTVSAPSKRQAGPCAAGMLLAAKRSTAVQRQAAAPATAAGMPSVLPSASREQIL